VNNKDFVNSLKNQRSINNDVLLTNHLVGFDIINPSKNINFSYVLLKYIRAQSDTDIVSDFEGSDIEYLGRRYKILV